MRIFKVLALAVVCGAAAEARDVYKVEFEIRDGSEPAQRYTVLVDETGKGAVRATKRVTAGTPAQEVEVGAILQCEVQERGAKAGLHAEVELTRVAGDVLVGGTSQPVLNQRKAAFDVAVDWGSATPVKGLNRTQVSVMVSRLP